MFTQARLAGSATFPLAALYCLVPWIWKRKDLYSRGLVEWHFWISTIGIVFYIASMDARRCFTGTDVARL